MKSKNLALTNGIIGLVGGIILIIGIWFVAAGAVADVASGSKSAASTTGVAAFLNILKLVILGLGIWGAVYYRGSDKVTTAPSVLMIVGGAISLIPFLGWIGGILAIIGGSLYLSKLKNFKNETK